MALATFALHRLPHEGIIMTGHASSERKGSGVEQSEGKKKKKVNLWNVGNESRVFFFFCFLLDLDFFPKKLRYSCLRFILNVKKKTSKQELMFFTEAQISMLCSRYHGESFETLTESDEEWVASVLFTSRSRLQMLGSWPGMPQFWHGHAEVTQQPDLGPTKGKHDNILLSHPSPVSQTSLFFCQPYFCSPLRSLILAEKGRKIEVEEQSWTEQVFLLQMLPFSKPYNVI